MGNLLKVTALVGSGSAALDAPGVAGKTAMPHLAR